MASKGSTPLLTGDGEEPTPNQSPAWMVLFLLSGVAFTGNALISLIGPFLPQHFGEIGVSQVWTGVIFSGFPVAMLLSTPIATALMKRLGRPKVLVLGLVLQGLSSCAFGFADTATGGVGVNPQGALVIYVLSRFTCGCGGSFANNAIFAIAVDRFPDALGRVMSLNEVLIGVGFSVGPPIGTVLYMFGGFGMPFYAAGGVVMAFAPFALMVKDAGGGDAAGDAAGDEGDSGGKGSGLLDILTLGLVVPGLSLFFATSVFGVVNSTLSLYLQNEVGVSEAGIGNMFCALSISYALNGCLVGGPVMDRVGSLFLCAAGGILAGLSLAVGLGVEASILPRGSEARMAYMAAVLVVLGLAQAMTLIPSLPSMHASLTGDNANATDAVVAWFNIFLQLGLAVSPIVGTSMVSAMGDHGFERTMMICGSVIAAYGTLAFCYAIKHPTKHADINSPSTPPLRVRGASVGYITPQSSPTGRNRGLSALRSPVRQV